RPDRATLGARSAGLPPQPAIERSYRGRQPHRREAPKNRTWFPQLSELSPPATSQPWCEMANSTHHQDTRPPTPQDRVEPLFEPQRPVTEVSHLRQGVRHEYDRPGSLQQLPHRFQALLAELG